MQAAYGQADVNYLLQHTKPLLASGGRKSGSTDTKLLEEVDAFITRQVQDGKAASSVLVVITGDDDYTQAIRKAMNEGMDVEILHPAGQTSSNLLATIRGRANVWHHDWLEFLDYWLRTHSKVPGLPARLEAPRGGGAGPGPAAAGAAAGAASTGGRNQPGPQGAAGSAGNSAGGTNKQVKGDAAAGKAKGGKGAARTGDGAEATNTSGGGGGGAKGPKGGGTGTATSGNGTAGGPTGPKGNNAAAACKGSPAAGPKGSPAAAGPSTGGAAGQKSSKPRDTASSGAPGGANGSAGSAAASAKAAKGDSRNGAGASKGAAAAAPVTAVEPVSAVLQLSSLPLVKGAANPEIVLACICVWLLEHRRENTDMYRELHAVANDADCKLLVGKDLDETGEILVTHADNDEPLPNRKRTVQSVRDRLRNTINDILQSALDSGETFAGGCFSPNLQALAAGMARAARPPTGGAAPSGGRDRITPSPSLSTGELAQFLRSVNVNVPNPVLVGHRELLLANVNAVICAKVALGLGPFVLPDGSRLVPDGPDGCTVDRFLRRGASAVASALALLSVPQLKELLATRGVVLPPHALEKEDLTRALAASLAERPF